MPERKVYSASGGKNSDFHNSLEKFAREKYPMQEGKIYKKDPSVYDDDGFPYQMPPKKQKGP